MQNDIRIDRQQKIPLHWPDGLNHPVSQMYHFQDLLWCPVMNTIRMFRFRPRDKNIALVGGLRHRFLEGIQQRSRLTLDIVICEIIGDLNLVTVLNGKGAEAFQKKA